MISAACSRAPACGESRWSIAAFSSHGASTRWAASTSSAIHGDRALDEWVPLDTRAAALMAFDPMTGRSGALNVRGSGDVREVYLQIPAGGSLIVAESPAAARASFNAYRTAGEPVAVAGPWTVRFVKGGPQLPSQRAVDRLVSWTTFGQDAEIFSGTATYTTTFAKPTAQSEQWQLDLGRVAETARVSLNGQNRGDAHRTAVSSGAGQLAACGPRTRSKCR